MCWVSASHSCGNPAQSPYVCPLSAHDTVLPVLPADVGFRSGSLTWPRPGLQTQGVLLLSYICKPGAVVQSSPSPPILCFTISALCPEVVRTIRSVSKAGICASFPGFVHCLAFLALLSSHPPPCLVSFFPAEGLRAQYTRVLVYLRSSGEAARSMFFFELGP